MSRHKVLNTPAIRRMPTYYHKLLSMQAQGETFASTSTLAAYMSTDPIVVRKDFELTGVTGSRGVGYRIDDLICAIRTYLGWDRSMRACLIGAGSLGTALLGFHEFTDEYGNKRINKKNNGIIWEETESGVLFSFTKGSYKMKY